MPLPNTRGLVFIILNVVRLLSVVGIILVFASNVVIMAHDIEAVNKQASLASQNNSMTTSNSTLSGITCDYLDDSTVPNQPAGPFWAVLNRLLIIFQVIVLFCSEIGWPSTFFNRFFPILGDEFGLGALGIIQALIGAAVLSHHVDDFALVSAFFLFSIGCVNMLLGLIFRASAKPKRAGRAWIERNIDPLMPGPGGFSPMKRTGSIVSYPSVRQAQTDPEQHSLGFGRQGEKAAGLKGFMISQPVQSLPKYAPSR